MKKYLFAAMLLTATVSMQAQHAHGNKPANSEITKADSSASPNVANEATQKQLNQILSSYYNIKNALVAGDAGSASTNASAFLRVANSIDLKVISEGNAQLLSKDAGRISETKDIAKQRSAFASLSSNLVSVAKSLKLTDRPGYVQYCPMKKAYWLSSEKEIRNPYYGSSMLTCGEVKDTF